MPPEPLDPTAPVHLHTTPTTSPVPPPWTSEALLLLTHARVTGLWPALVAHVRVPRGKAGTFEVPDFLLLLLLYALGYERTLERFFAALQPVRALLATVVGRREGPAASTLSRWLGDVTTTALEAARAVFFDDLLAHGLRDAPRGGLVDRLGTHHVVFDADGTREVHRQRELPDDPAHPPARRRFDRTCAPGYTGRKRGETLRTRTVVQQAHTREWLGTWGHAGNGDVKAELAAALAAVTRYLAAHGLAAAQGVLRLDGIYGHHWAVDALGAAGLGFVMRVANYHLLTRAVVRRVLADGSVATYTSPETGATSEVFEVHAFDWHGRVVRLLITRRPLARGSKPRIGVRRGAWAYELFATNRTAPGLTCTDVVSLYHARGGFESTLAEEDRAGDPDRWVSGQPFGQELWQLLAQWVWNARLRLGVAANDAPGVRTTIWAEALPALPPCTPATAIPRGASAACGAVCAAAGRSAGQYGGADFAWTPGGLLRCPAGALLRPTERRVEPLGVRVIFQASVRDCFGCDQAAACRGHGATMGRGRRVSVIYTATANDAPGPRAPVLWLDVAAHALRTTWTDALGREALDVGPAPAIAPRPLPRLTRARRARRRLTWVERYARNALPVGTAAWPVVLHGVAPGLHKLLQSQEALRAVA